MKIRKVEANNRRKAFEVETKLGLFAFPYARLRVKPTTRNRVAAVFADPELRNEAFSYALENGQEDTIHLDEVLEYNEDPTYLKDLFLYRLTVEAQKRVAASALSKREIIRRLGTSASQFYRLLDPTNYTKSVGQLVALLHILDYDVDIVVKKRKAAAASTAL
jgi:hypothetical protein